MPDTDRYAKQTFTTDGILQQFQFDLPYLNVADLNVTLNGAALEYGEDWELMTASVIRLMDVPPDAQPLVIIRTTAIATAAATFVSPGTFTFANLNRIVKQLLYGVQEAFDRTVQGVTILADAEAAAARAEAAEAEAEAALADLLQRYLGALPSNPVSATTGQMYFHTGTGRLRVYSSGAWIDPTPDTTDFYTEAEVDALLTAYYTSTQTNSAIGVAVAAAIAALPSSTAFTAGDGKLTLKTVADTGWVMCDDGTISKAGSGGTTRANADCSALYAVLWGVSNTYAPVSGGRGASAAADFAAGKTIGLTKQLGRAIAVAGGGAGLTSRALGFSVGVETHTLTVDEQMSMPITGAIAGPIYTNGEGGVANSFGLTGDGANIDPASEMSGTAVGGGGAHNNMQPTAFWNVMLKL